MMLSLDIKSSIVQDYCMRTTMTIDEDVAKKLKKRKNGQSFKEVVNETLRNGLLYAAQTERKPEKPFKLKGRLLRSKMPFNFNKVHRLVEVVDEEYDLK